MLPTFDLIPPDKGTKPNKPELQKKPLLRVVQDLSLPLCISQHKEEIKTLQQ